MFWGIEAEIRLSQVLRSTQSRFRGNDELEEFKGFLKSLARAHRRLALGQNTLNLCAIDPILVEQLLALEEEYLPGESLDQHVPFFRNDHQEPPNHWVNVEFRKFRYRHFYLNPCANRLKNIFLGDLLLKE